jgi:hypothetical protein
MQWAMYDTILSIFLKFCPAKLSLVCCAHETAIGCTRPCFKSFLRLPLPSSERLVQESSTICYVFLSAAPSKFQVHMSPHSGRRTEDVRMKKRSAKTVA